MTDSDAQPASSEFPQIDINIKGPDAKLQIKISLDKTVAELKEVISTESGVEAERQRLIYGGRVLKDEELLSNYKIRPSDTIHMVKGAARSSTSGSSSTGAASTAAPQQLPTMQAGQNPSDPLTILNGPMGHGMLNSNFNPFADMGLNANDPNMMQGILENPAFLQQMSSLMANPAVLDQIISMNPQLAAMGPQVRQMMQSDTFRQMMSNPQMLQQAMRMSQLMGGMHGAGPFGGGFGGGAGANAFPAPGLPSNAQQQQQQPAQPQTSPSQPQSPSMQQGQNPYSALATLLGSMPAPPQGATNLGGGAGTTPNPTAGPTAGGGAAAGTPPFGAIDPALVQSLLGGMGGFGGFGGMGAGAGAGVTGSLGAGTPLPADTRSPEERYQVQLQQLQDMGFTNAAQNVRALLATGGNVHAAIEYILGGGGL